MDGSARRIYIGVSLRALGANSLEMSDADLLLRARDGDETAFLLLYERHHHAVYRVAYRLVSDVTQAEDVRHECFMSLVRFPDRFDPARGSLRTFLLAVARHHALTIRRRRQWQNSTDDLNALPDRASVDPLGRLLQEELARIVRAAVEDLPYLQREAVVLVHYEHLSLPKAASVVGANVGTVKARLHRARVRLRHLLARFIGSTAATASRRAQR